MRLRNPVRGYRCAVCTWPSSKATRQQVEEGCGETYFLFVWTSVFRFRSVQSRQWSH